MHIRHGTETMRQAAVSIYAENLADEQVGRKCGTHLQTLFDDDSEDVRKKVSWAFAGLPGTKLLEFESLIKQYIESKSFQNETDYLIHAFETSRVELPKMICRAAQRILEFVGEEGAYITSENSMVANSISKLIIRQYEQSADKNTKRECLDLIDQMERIGYLGIDSELSRIDR